MVTGFFRPIWYRKGNKPEDKPVGPPKGDSWFLILNDDPIIQKDVIYA